MTASGRIRRTAGRALTFAGSALAPPTAPPPDTSPPSSFRRWVARRSDRLRGSLPPSWLRVVPEGPVTSRIAVVMHVYYAELLPELLEQLHHIPVRFDLIATNATGAPLEIGEHFAPNVDRVVVLDVENRGRDILPLVSVVNADLLEPYELVLKVHTKRSAWREDHGELDGSGDEWRKDFVHGLLGSRANVERILDEFATQPRTGLVTTSGNVLGPEFWGGNEHVTLDLLRRIQLTPDPGALRFAAGSMYWVRAFVLQGLRAFALDQEDFEEEAGQVNVTTAHAVERAIGIVTREAGYELVETSSVAAGDGSSAGIARYAHDVDVQPRARVIPFYLPQYHTFPENDSWWGAGFTEWSNVAAAKPVYEGQNQPFLPSDLGFYDLTMPGVRAQQYELARSFGIEGFMYYYYWFAGRKLMDRPVEELLAGDANEPFCLMWANENWTRRWDGSERDILIAQDYDEVPATEFIHDVMPLLTDDRYLRIDGKPILAVYRITQIPDFESVIEHWRSEAKRNGIDELMIITVDVGRSMDGIDEDDLGRHGLDAFLEFPPHNMQWTAQDRRDLSVDHRFAGNISSYGALASNAQRAIRSGIDANRYPGVMVNFDNTARRQWQPDVWYGSNPYTFRRWLNASIAAIADRDRDHRAVFINAWNEWAEGAVLEPSQRFGRTYLLAVRDAVYR